MGALLGLLFGLGILLIARSFGSRDVRRPRGRRPAAERIREVLVQAGLDGVRPGQLVGVSAGAGIFVAFALLGISRSVPVALAFGLIACRGPWVLIRHRARRRQAELRMLWPDVVDNLASAVRAGLALPEALSQLAERGPSELRPAFARFAQDYRSTGRFADALDHLKGHLADPVGDRIVEALRISRDVGGSDLGRMLRTLSSFLREEARIRAELETRQGWTVNGARLAVAAPWILLVLLSLHPTAVRAYNSAAGVFVLGLGAGVSVVAYRLMVRLGRLPSEERVLR